ncbi:MAG: HAD hydrolase-like protein [Methylococcaceae bacterium]
MSVNGYLQQSYCTFVFDCDGVIIDSNPVKTEAYRQVAQPYGEDIAKALVEYHVIQGGVSRYEKFAYMLTELLGEPLIDEKVRDLARLFSECMYNNLLTCPVTEGLKELRRATERSRWMIVSGGDQNELRRLFVERGIASLFDGGIFGSPDNKDETLAREQLLGNLSFPALFVGDSRYDHEAAERAGIDFVFASAWTEFSDWQEYAATWQFPVVSSVRDLAPIFADNF